MYAAVHTCMFIDMCQYVLYICTHSVGVFILCVYINFMIVYNYYLCTYYKIVERGSSVVECRTRNRECSGSNPPFGTISKFGHFRSLHGTPGYSAV